MAINVAISGFGRIGRNVLRAIGESGRTDVNVVAINDLGSPEHNVHMMQYDSVHGKYPKDISLSGDMMDAGTGGPIKVLAERDPTKLPWGELGVDLVMECTGIFNDKDKAMMHVNAGAKKVLCSAPATNADKTIVYGVNHDTLEASDVVVSNASCTTNCLSPMAKVLDDLCGIEPWLHDHHSCVHRRPEYPRWSSWRYVSRSCSGSFHDPNLNWCSQSRWPCASTACWQARWCRHPRTNTKRISRRSEIRACARNFNRRNPRCHETGCRRPDEKHPAICRKKLVSIDFNHDAHSSNFDSNLTQIVAGKLIRVVSWYDNEWGFSNRMNDTAVAMMKA